MNKLLSSVGLAIGIATASLIAGCQLYFGDHDSSNDTPSPGVGSGSNGSGAPPGYACGNDAQCAAGCYCADGTCTEGGFCSSNKDCGNGFHCDTARASCIPDTGCTKAEQCAPGSTCDANTGACVATCKCLTDADAVAQGAGYCDESRGTCMPGIDPAGACAGAITCSTAAPKCPEGQVALRKDGCYTGACEAISACSATPACSSLAYQNDCSARKADCSMQFTGHNCTGTSCGIDTSDCVCQVYTFSACVAKGQGANLLLVQ